MLVPLSQKAAASETVSPVLRSLSGCVFVKRVGNSCIQSYQKTLAQLQRLLTFETGIDQISNAVPILGALTRRCDFPVILINHERVTICQFSGFRVPASP